MAQEIIEIEPAISDETFDFEFDPNTMTIEMKYKVVGEKAKICINGKNKKWLYVM